MENKWGKLVAGVGKNTKDVLEKSKNIAMHIVDQNDDGKVDLEDFSSAASSMKNSAMKSAQVLKETIDEKTRQRELQILKPLVLEDLSGLTIPRFLRMTERNGKFAEKESYKETIGCWTDFKGERLLNIFRDSVDSYGLSFYPNCENEFYYVNPIDKDNYIVLDEYFDYLKQVRIGELQKIAQDLGAKYFKVTYKEEKTSFSVKNKNKKAGIKSVAEINVEQDLEENKYSKVEIAAEMKCSGHAPIEPKLKYMKYDPSINNLIELRMNSQGPLNHQKLTLKLSNSSGLKESEAVKIDSILKGLKCTCNSTVVSETQNESRRYLEYEIDF